MYILSSLTPIALHSAGISTSVVSSPISVYPVPGFCWWPVIPVILLSKITDTLSDLLYTASIRLVIPEWKKVESPRHATTLVSA